VAILEWWSPTMLKRETVDPNAFNPKANLPFQLRHKDFEIAMQDVYDFFYDVNALFQNKGCRDWMTN
jgi:hypothetical protein